MAGKHLNREETQRIRELAELGMTQREIAVAVNRSQTAVLHVLRKHDNTAKKQMHCPHCRRQLPPMEGMIFCCWCAADIRTPARKAAAGLQDVLKRISTYYPQNLRDEAVAALNNAIKILEEAD